MTAQEEAARIVVSLLAKGFSQTDVARGLGLTAKGSGSYIGQIVKGLKGSGKVGELRALDAAATAASEIPVGRGREATAARQAILSGKVEHKPRMKKAGGAAAVRQPGVKVSERGYGQATDAQAGLANSGGPNCANLISAYGAYPGGRIAIRVVGRFTKDSAAHRSSYWQAFYGKKKRKPSRKKGSGNVLEASFGNAGNGFSAADWQSYVEAAGSFTEALTTWMTVNGYDIPDALLRVEISAWVN